MKSIINDVEVTLSVHDTQIYTNICKYIQYFCRAKVHHAFSVGGSAKNHPAFVGRTMCGDRGLPLSGDC